MQVKERRLDEADAVAASRLVQRSFSSLAAMDWEPSARATFLEKSCPSGLARSIGTCTYSLAAFVEGEMVGLILLLKPGTLTLLFVDPAYTRQGIATLLWNRARKFLLSLPEQVDTVALNATPCAVPFYRSAGFLATANETTIKGCRFVPMSCRLRPEPSAKDAP